MLFELDLLYMQFAAIEVQPNVFDTGLNNFKEVHKTIRKGGVNMQ